MKKLEKIAITTLPMTTRGHRRIVNPAIGMQAVSRNGPSRLIRSCMSLYHPLNNINGLLTTAIAVYRGISTISPIKPTIIHPGTWMNLQYKIKHITIECVNCEILVFNSLDIHHSIQLYICWLLVYFNLLKQVILRHKLPN